MLSSLVMAQNNDVAKSANASLPGTHNTLVGPGVSDPLTGGGNSFFGINAGNSTTSGLYNVFLGLNAGNKNITGDNNGFTGINSGYSNTTGYSHIAGGDMKDFQQAYVFQLERNQRMNSTSTVRTSAEVQRMVAQYETEKKEAQIKLLQQQATFTQQEAERTRFRTNALLIGAALLMLLGGAISAWLLNQSKLHRLEEAQKLRKQIAHDLHDEVGSTLSSISLLSGHTNTLLSQKQPGVDTSESAQKMVQKIYTDARQILESIDEIIWTINPDNDTLHRIALRLQEYAQPLMESKNITFSFQMDAAMEETLISMEVRRNLYLISKEAINNLIKYSQATQATVCFEKKDNQLQVLIEDNGRGFVADGASQRNGQANMRQRALSIGGTLAVDSTTGQGTRLQLTMNP